MELVGRKGFLFRFEFLRVGLIQIQLVTSLRCWVDIGIGLVENSSERLGGLGLGWVFFLIQRFGSIIGWQV